MRHFFGASTVIIFSLLTLLTQSGCGLAVKLALDQVSECKESAQLKIESNSVYYCGSNLGVRSWRKQFECDDPAFSPVIHDSVRDGGKYQEANCIDKDGNIKNPKHYLAARFCAPTSAGKWLYVTGFTYSRSDYTTLANKYWFKCDPQKRYDWPAPETADGQPSTDDRGYKACGANQTLEIDSSGNPVCQ
jgi:hypothetical protein